LKNDTSLQEKEDMGNHQVKDSTGSPLPDANKTIGGQKMLSIIMGVFTCVVAAPVLLIYFIKSPPPPQDVYTFGISYYNLVFIFLISAAGLIISLLFFLRFNLFLTLAIFITSLFCCLPLIIGLKDDLTLQQAILNIPFFSGWPFFLRPLYIFVELLLPIGILIFLSLQLKSIFSRKAHGYTFLGVAVYLAATAFIGFSGLIQAEQPTIMTALARHGYIFVNSEDHSTVSKGSSENHTGSGEEIQSSGILSSDPQSKIADQSKNALGKSRLPVGDSKMAMLDDKVELLEEKIDRVSKELKQVMSHLTGQDQSAPAPGESLPPGFPQDVQTSKRNVLAEIDYSLGLLSDKVNQMDESIEKLKNPVVDHQPSTIVDVRQKVELLTVKLDQLLSRLNQTEYSITQQQDSIDKRSEAPGSITKDQKVTSSELAGVVQKIKLLSDKVELISDTLLKKGLYAPEEGEIKGK